MKQFLLTLMLVFSSIFAATADVIDNVQWWVESTNYPGTARAVMIVYYPCLGQAYAWGYNFEPDQGAVVGDMMVDIYEADDMLEFDGADSGFLNSATYDGYSEADEDCADPDAGMAGYWMYNVNDASAQLGLSSMELQDGDIIVWEYKQDWSSWDCTAVADLPEIIYVGSEQDAPIEITVTHVSYDNVTISWTPSANATGYNIYCNGTLAARVGMVNTYTLSNLREQTHYTIGVCAVNLGQITSSTTTVEATTSKAYAVNLADAVWNFDDYSNTKGVIAGNTNFVCPNDWIVGNAGSGKAATAYLPYIYPSKLDNTNSYGYDGRLCERIYGLASTSRVPVYAVLPLIKDVQGYDSLVLNFYGKGEPTITSTPQYGNLRIGYITSLDDTLKTRFAAGIHNFLDTTLSMTQYDYYQIPLKGIPAGARVVFYDDDATKLNSCLLDNISFSKASAAVEPVCPTAVVVKDTVEVCEDDMPYSWNGHSLSAAGTYTDTLRYVSGCDSIIRSIVLTTKVCSTEPKTYPDHMQLYVNYPQLNACFAWTIWFDATDDEQNTVAALMDTLMVNDPNHFAVDGHLSGFVTDIMIFDDQDNEYDGLTIDELSNYWMYNVDDQLSSEYCHQQTIVNNQTVLWEYREDWLTNWDVANTAIADLSNVRYMGAIHGPEVATALSHTTSETAIKVIRNGQIYIIRNNQTYTIQGLMIK